MWHPASYARETSAGADNMYRDVGAAEEGGVDLKAKFEWKREQGRLYLWKGYRRIGRTGWAIGLYGRLSRGWWCQCVISGREGRKSTQA